MQQILCVAFSQTHEWDSQNVVMTGSTDGVVRVSNGLVTFQNYFLLCILDRTSQYSVIHCKVVNYKHDDARLALLLQLMLNSTVHNEICYHVFRIVNMVTVCTSIMDHVLQVLGTVKTSHRSRLLSMYFLMDSL